MTKKFSRFLLSLFVAFLYICTFFSFIYAVLEMQFENHISNMYFNWIVFKVSIFTYVLRFCFLKHYFILPNQHYKKERNVKIEKIKKNTFLEIATLLTCNYNHSCSELWLGLKKYMIYGYNPKFLNWPRVKMSHRLWFIKRLLVRISKKAFCFSSFLQICLLTSKRALNLDGLNVSCHYAEPLYRVIYNYWYQTKRLFGGLRMDVQKIYVKTFFCTSIKAPFNIK